MPVGADEEFFEVPSHVACVALVVGLLAKRCVDGVTVRTVDVHLRRQGEGDAIALFGEGANLLMRAGLLRAELVAWEADDGEVIVFGVETLEIGILPGQATGAGHVDHQQASAVGDITQRCGRAVNHVEVEVEEVAHDCSKRPPHFNHCPVRTKPQMAPPSRWAMQVRMETSAGDILLTLYHGNAPDTVANFVKLVSEGYYDGLHFHRVIADFMLQGGCPHSKDPMSRRAGTGGPGWQIPCEPSALALKHDRPGILSMANAGRDTGGSQFFITTVATPWLNGNHAVFGEVSEGMDVVKAIEACQKMPGDRPASPQKIVRCTLIE